MEIKKKFEKNISGLDIAKSISEGLARISIGLEINNKFFDIDSKIKNDCKINIITIKNDENNLFLKFKTLNIIEDILKKNNVEKNFLMKKFFFRCQYRKSGF